MFSEAFCALKAAEAEPSDWPRKLDSQRAASSCKNQRPRSTAKAPGAARSEPRPRNRSAVEARLTLALGSRRSTQGGLRPIGPQRRTSRLRGEGLLGSSACKDCDSKDVRYTTRIETSVFQLAGRAVVDRGRTPLKRGLSFVGTAYLSSRRLRHPPLLAPPRLGRLVSFDQQLLLAVQALAVPAPPGRQPHAQHRSEQVPQLLAGR